jgi:hypothetical protein
LTDEFEGDYCTHLIFEFMRGESVLLLLGNILRVLENIETIASQKGIEAIKREEWLDTFDMLQRFHISRTTLHRLKKSGDLVPSKLGKKDVYLLSDVNLVLAKRRGKL